MPTGKTKSKIFLQIIPQKNMLGFNPQTIGLSDCILAAAIYFGKIGGTMNTMNEQSILEKCLELQITLRKDLKTKREKKSGLL